MDGDATITAREALEERGFTTIHRLTRVHPGPPVAFTLSKRVALGREPGAGGVTVEDPECSRKHAELSLSSDVGVYRLKDLDSKNGTFLFGQRVDAPEYVGPGAVIRIGGTIFVYGQIELSGPPRAPDPSISPARAEAEALADRAAPSELPVLVLGPTGAGKELIAQRIHDKSGRKGKLVAVNCATFSHDLVASELFGHKAGAFSGASADRPGLFVAASGGTLFLDEIAELPVDQQAAMLRALQDKRIRPVGSDDDREVDVRVVAATHQPIELLVEEGKFREDLYARLAAVTIDLPGLADRREEILGLFLEFLGEKHPPLTVHATELLLTYDWPRNVRELLHAAEHVKLADEQTQIETSHLPKTLQRARRTGPTVDEKRPSKESVEKALARHDGNVAKAARTLGQHRQTLYRLIQAYGVDPKGYRS